MDDARRRKASFIHGFGCACQSACSAGRRPSSASPCLPARGALQIRHRNYETLTLRYDASMAKQQPAIFRERAWSAGVDSQIGRAFIGLREMLLHGELAVGERISELPLVARLGTSRTPIRLALERLAHIGLL